VYDHEQPDTRSGVTARALPKEVEVSIGGHWLSVTAHATRYGRRGHQVLIDHYGRLVWVSASRLRPARPLDSVEKVEDTAEPTQQ